MARSGWGVGRKLEDAGKPQEAIRAHVEALPLMSQEEARDLWNDSLSGQPEVSAPALVALAALYREQAYAWEQAPELLKQAAKAGSDEALAERARLATLEGKELSEAARLLFDLARYDAADAIAERCLAVDPTNQRALDVQAGVLARLPAQDKQARAKRPPSSPWAASTRTPEGSRKRRRLSPPPCRPAPTRPRVSRAWKKSSNSSCRSTRECRIFFRRRSLLSTWSSCDGS